MIKISFGGDFCFANDPTTRRIGLVNRYDPLYKQKLTSALKHFFSEADISVINFESPISNTFEESNGSAFLMPPEVLDILLESNINVLNFANNHILQYGEKVFDNTFSSVKSRDFKIIGKYESDIRNSFVSYEINKIKIAIAGFNERHDFPNKQKYSVLDRKTVLDVLNIMAEEKYDIRILVFHWGNEYINFPSRRQSVDAHYFIDKGANVIIGHHSHVMQPVEKYNGGIIAYSLGNLLFDNLYSRQVRMGIVFNLLFDGNEFDYEVIPIWLDEEKIFDKSKTEFVKKEYELILSNFNNFKILDDALYDLVYNKNLRRERSKQRFFMKLHLLQLFFKLGKNEKKQLIKNIADQFRRRTKSGLC